jgi:hypothetical protein
MSPSTFVRKTASTSCKWGERSQLVVVRRQSGYRNRAELPHLRRYQLEDPTYMDPSIVNEHINASVFGREDCLNGGSRALSVIHVKPHDHQVPPHLQAQGPSPRL